MSLFFELIRISLGYATAFRNAPSPEEWAELLEQAKSHSLVGALSPALDVLPREQGAPLLVYSKWMLMTEMIQKANSEQRNNAKRLCGKMSEDGIRTCVLKGQGLSLYYPHPDLRHCGDIDVWMEGERKDSLAYLRSKGRVGDVVYHHCDVALIKGAHIEAHFTPSWMNSPVLNRRLQEFFSREAGCQFDNFNGELGFCVPDVRFNAVYEMVHIFRHLFYEGVALKPFMDYYYTLQYLPVEDRQYVLAELQRVGLGKFTAAAMWLLSEVFALDERLLVCPADPRMGRKLLAEVMDVKMKQGGLPGNFGRILRCFRFCPREAFAAPFFKSMQFLWRKSKGYFRKK